MKFNSPNNRGPSDYNNHVCPSWVPGIKHSSSSLNLHVLEILSAFIAPKAFLDPSCPPSFLSFVDVNAPKAWEKQDLDTWVFTINTQVRLYSMIGHRQNVTLQKSDDLNCKSPLPGLQSLVTVETFLWQVCSCPEWLHELS